MGVELQKSSYACAVRNVEINGLLDRIDIFNTDVCESGALKAEIIERNKKKGILRDGHVDVVVSKAPSRFEIFPLLKRSKIGRAHV